MIEVGEYVRTKNGAIFKIIGGNYDDYDIDIAYYELGKIEDDTYSDLTMYNYNDNGNFIRDIIKKHSFNIIDLVEIGDFIEILADGEPLRFEVDEIDYKHKLKDIAEDIKIKSIITKEQMKNIEYIVEDNK